MHVNSLPVFLISSLLNGINAILLLFCLGFAAWGGLTIHALDWLILIALGLSSGLFYVFLVFWLPESRWGYGFIIDSGYAISNSAYSMVPSW